MRIFIAIDLPDEIKKKIDGFQKEISSRVFLKMVPPKNLHLTLVFLGEILETDKQSLMLRNKQSLMLRNKQSLMLRNKQSLMLRNKQSLMLRNKQSLMLRNKDKVIEAVREGIKEIKPFHLFLDKPELFPKYGKIHGLWINVKGQLDILHKLYQQIQAEFEKREIVYDHKPFTAHITVGRAKRKTPRLEFSPMAKGEFLVDSVSVYSSKLTPKGPIHSKLEAIRLK